MTCREITNLLPDYLAGELEAALVQRLERHLRTCTDCANYLGSYRRTIDIAKAALVDVSDGAPAVPSSCLRHWLERISRSAGSSCNRGQGGSIGVTAPETGVVILANDQPERDTASSALRAHWPLYLMEAALLGLFMISACSFAVLLQYPASPLHRLIGSPLLRRALMGLAIGLTAVTLIYCYWGRRSGAHMNPAVTLSFLRLGKISRWDAFFYIMAQFVGGLTGVALVRLVIAPFAGHPAIRYIATSPGSYGIWAAWVGEFAIAFLLMSLVLGLNKHRSLAPYTGCFVGALLIVYITFEAPLSGMSMNPARTFGSAFWAHVWMGLWIYFTAPVAGMLAAVEAHRLFSRSPHRLCGRMNHCPGTPTIFQCDCLQAADKPRATQPA